MNRVYIWDRIDVRIDTGCWEWVGTINHHNGYGYVRAPAGIRPINQRAHRVVYEMEKGPIPSGLQIDHLCRNRRCVNPAHMEPVTSRANTLRGDGPTSKNARKTHCKRGHILDGANINRYRGWRLCRICKNALGRKYKRAKRIGADLSK